MLTTECQSPEDVAALVDRLRDLEAGPRAFFEVIGLGRRAVPALEALLRGCPESVYQPRCLAADALGTIRGAAAVDALLRALADSLGRELDPVLREAEAAVINRVAENLGQIGDPRAADLLLEALAAHPYAGCVRALGRLREARSIALVAACLHDDVARGAAMEALRSFGRAALPELTRVLLRPRTAHGVEGGSRVAGRAAAAALLGEIGGCEAHLRLLWALFDGQREVRRAAALALGDVREPDAAAVALPVLVEALGDADWARVEPAAKALARLGPEVADPLLAAIAPEAGDPEARRRSLRAVELLGRVGAARVVGPLAALAGARDGRLRLAAAGALTRLPGDDATEALARFGDDPEATVRLRAVEALGARGLAALDVIVRALGDGDSRVRTAAGEALRRIGAPAAPALRAAAARAMRLPGSWRSRWRVRRAARRLLRGLALAPRSQG